MLSVSGYGANAELLGMELAPRGYGGETVHVRKIVVDPSSGQTTVIVPIMPLGKVAKSGFGVADDEQNAYQHCCRAIGKADLTLMKTLDGHFAHPSKDALSTIENYRYQQTYSVGKLQYVFPKVDSQRRLWGAFNVTDHVAQSVFQKYEDSYNQGIIPLWTSAQIVNSASENQKAIRYFDLMHVTLTDDPAFGKELTQVGAVCQGPVQSCVLKFNAASNARGSVGINLYGDIVDLRYETCPFCVETALTNIMEQNIKVNQDSFNIFNRGSNINMPDDTKTEGTEKKPETEVVQPDAAKDDKQKDDSSANPLNGMMKEVLSKVDELAKKTEANTIKTDTSKPEEEKKPETKADEKPDAQKPTPIDWEAVSKDPKFEEIVNKKIEDKIESIKEKDTDYQQMKNEARYNMVGGVLASRHRNFIDPNTGKPDAKKFDAALDFFMKSNYTKPQIEAMLDTISPFATAETSPTEEQAPVQTHKASNTRGVPTTNAAFEDKDDKKVNKASNSNLSDIHDSIRFVDAIITDNSA